MQRGRCDARRSGSDGHVVPVAGRPLGDAVAAQVLVDVRHLLCGGTIGHVQGWVIAVKLWAPHVHRLQQMLAVQHADLRGTGGGAGSFSFLLGNLDLCCDWRVSPARWSVCSWRCWDHGAPLRNTGSLLDLGPEADPPGTAAQLDHAKQNRRFKGYCRSLELPEALRHLTQPPNPPWRNCSVSKILTTASLSSLQGMGLHCGPTSASPIQKTRLWHSRLMKMPSWLARTSTPLSMWPRSLRVKWRWRSYSMRSAGGKWTLCMLAELYKGARPRWCWGEILHPSEWLTTVLCISFPP